MKTFWPFIHSLFVGLLLQIAAVATPPEAIAETGPALKLIVERGHSDAVQAAAFARGGKVVITVGSSQAIAWDVAAGRELRPLQGHSDMVRAIAVNREDLVATGSSDGTARIWDMATGAELKRIVVHRPGTGPLSGSVRAVAFSPDGRTLRVLDQDYGAYPKRKQFVTTWDVRTGLKQEQFALRSESIEGAAFSKDSAYVAVWYRGGSIVVHDARSGRIISTTKLCRSAEINTTISPVAISPDNTQFICLGSSEISAYGLMSGRQKWSVTLSGDEDQEVMAATFSIDGSRLFVATKDRPMSGPQKDTETAKLRSLDPSTGALLSEIEIGQTKFELSGPKVVGTTETGTGVNVEALSVVPNGNQLFISTSGRVQYLIDAASGRVMKTYESNIEYVEDLALSEDFSRLATATGTYALSWNLRSGLPEASLPLALKASRSGFIADGPYLNMHFSQNSSSKLIIADRDYLHDVDFADRTVKDTPRQTPLGYLEARSDDGELALISTNKAQRMASSISGFGQEAIFANGANLAATGDPILFEAYLPGQMLNLFGPSPSIFSPSADSIFEVHAQRVCRFMVRERSEKCFSNGVSDSRIGADVAAFAVDKGDTKFAVALSSDAKVGATLVWPAHEENKLLLMLVHPAAVRSLAFLDDNNIVTGDGEGWIRKWDLHSCLKQITYLKKIPTCQKPLWSIKAHDGSVTSITVAATNGFIVSGSSDGMIKLWGSTDGQLVANLVTSLHESMIAGHLNNLPMRDWVALGADGRFDPSSLDSVRGLHWSTQDDPFRILAPETFFRDYYEPRLLPRLLACHEAEARGEVVACKNAFQAVHPLAELNRIQPEVTIVGVHRGASADEVLVDVEVAGKEDTTQKNGKTKTAVYDLRLFRDGQIVGQWPQPVSGIGGAEDKATWRVEAKVPMSDSLTKVVHEFPVRLARRNKGQAVMLSAYAFNEDRVKSATTPDEPYKVPDDLDPAQPRAYVITIGINAYENPNWKLGFAVKDAEDLSGALQQIQGYEVVPVSLVSTENAGSKTDQATKANIEDVLALLAGKEEVHRDRLTKAIGSVADKLHKATPDDLVILAFSGHGYTDPQHRFYLLPSDSGEEGISDATLPKILPRFISSDELSQWFKDVDAGELVTIIDACHSAASIPEGFKPGPMGDRGLGQLAYDKGMQILAATQVDNVALEVDKIGGLLTYALVQEGLVQHKAAPDGKVPVTIRTWLNYAKERVPELYDEAEAGKLKLAGFDSADKTRTLVSKDPTVDPIFRRVTARSAQTPALFDFYKQKSDPILLQAQ